jgi:hypothetical protein
VPVGRVRAVPGADPVHVEFLKHFRQTLADKNWDGFAACWRDDAVYGDRRSGLRSEVVGGAEAARIIESSFGERADFDYEINLVATRGRIGLYEGLAFGSGDGLAGPWEAERLVRYELGDDGRLIRGELFDPVERDRLLAEFKASTD